MVAPARTRQQRIEDTVRRLEHDIDVWVATAADDTPYLVPLSFLWDGTTLLIATVSDSPTGRNLRASGQVRLGLGLTRDVVLIEGTVHATPATEISNDVGDAFAAKAGFDPRGSTSTFHYFRVRPHRIQAWREENELANRDLMRDGRWLVARSSAPGPPGGSE
jgi:Pyridoxamine 5'-phosphate oxidase